MGRWIALAIITALIAPLLACAYPGMFRHPAGWGPAPKGKMLDGAYVGRASRGPVRAVVYVVIKHGRISRVRVVRHRCAVCGDAATIIPRRVIEYQSTRVDAVTGATVSSMTIMEAIQRAVDQAHLAWRKKHDLTPPHTPPVKKPAPSDHKRHRLDRG